MADTPKPRWYRLTPGRLLWLLLVAEGLLWLSDRLGWPQWHNGYAVLAAVASVSVFLLLMLLWFLAALIFRLRFQFSLLSLLVLVVAVALPCSWLAAEMKKARQQHEAVEGIRRGGNGGGEAWYSFQVTDRPEIFPEAEAPQWKWLCNLLGDDFFNDVIQVGIDEREDWVSVADADLAHLRKLPRLEWLSFGFCPKVTDAGMENLEGLTHLEYLWLGCTGVTDDGLKHLEKLNELRELQVGGPHITDDGLRHIGALTQLRKLDLWCGRRISGLGLKHLWKLPHLKELQLNDFGDPYQHDIHARAMSIKGLTQLDKLIFNGLYATPEEFAELRRTLPNCKVELLR